MGRADRCGARSDGVGEFGEGRGDPMPRVNVDTEFVGSVASVEGKIRAG
jgi:hypothetical protein